jgi:NAD(P)-dependent dehydrogenase (short-subunit alcohol dehydrogenase family)
VNPVAVVTGASRGLGLATVIELSSFGWDVVAVSRNRPTADDCRWILGDVGDDAVVAELLATVGEGQVDLLVNNAAVGADIVPLQSADVQSILNAVNVNVAGPFRMIKTLLPNLIRAPRPLIVNISSRLASMSAQARGDFAHLDSSYAYRVSKAAQNMLTVAVANEFAGRLRCWAVHPGALMTDMGLADAGKSAGQAARELRELVETPCDESPRFCSLGAADLDW